MKRFALRAALAAMVAPAPAVALPCGPVFMTDVPVSLERNHIYATVWIGSHPVKLMVDTGSNISILSPATARALKLRERRGAGSVATAQSLRGVGGDRAVEILVAPRARMGDVQINVMRFAVPTGPRDQNSGTDFDVLGMSVLGNFDIDFDLIGHRLVLFQANDQCAAPRVPIGGPLFEVPMVGGARDLHTLIPVSLNGHGMIAVLDTGAPFSIVQSSAVARAGLSARIITAAKPTRIGGFGAHADASAGRLVAPIEIGDMSIDHMRLGVVGGNPFGADILLGMDFLSHVHTWISRSTRKVVFQVPPTASPVVAADRE